MECCASQMNRKWCLIKALCKCCWLSWRKVIDGASWLAAPRFMTLRNPTILPSAWWNPKNFLQSEYDYYISSNQNCFKYKLRILLQSHKFGPILFRWVSLTRNIHLGEKRKPVMHKNVHTYLYKRVSYFAPRNYVSIHQTLGSVLGSPRRACQLLPYVNVVSILWTLIP